MRISIWLALVTACTLLQSSCGILPLGSTPRAQELTTIYVVRHAEKELGSAPGLTEKGAARADFYVTFFEETEISTVYSTPTRRTFETASPLAKSKGLEVTDYPNATEFDVFGQTLLEKHAGETILMVGHSNTVPLLVNALAGTTTYTDVPHEEYRRLYQVTVRGDGQKNVRLFMVP